MTTAQRDTDIINLYKNGHTLQEIGDNYGLSKQRVSQILKVLGVSRQEGGAALRAATALAKHNAQRDAKYRNHWGHSFEEHRKLLRLSRSKSKYCTPIGAFCNQRRSAKQRGIPWYLTFSEWWSVWEGSGKWHWRGRGQQGYVMSRKGDVGAYELNNVFIQQSIMNNSNTPRKQSGLPTGVTYQKGRFEVKKMRDGIRYYVGVFGTPIEAAATYCKS